MRIIQRMRLQSTDSRSSNARVCLRIREFHRQKEDKEAKKAEEQRLENLRKELEMTRLTTQTVHTNDVQVPDIEMPVFFSRVGKLTYNDRYR